MAPVLELQGITKRFPGVVANDGTDFDLHEGEVHALLGENGAGKTTLMKVVYGLLRADAGEIRIRGKPVQIRSPLDALAHGLGMVHQHFMLVPTMTVTENIMLGQERTRGPLLSYTRAENQIRELSAEYGLAIPPRRPVSELSVGEQQRVEILKVLYRGAEILILDEPTAVLTPPEAEALFQTLESMVQRGKSVIFISHKLKEVMRISDRVTVLRHGKVQGTLDSAETSEKELARMMVGRDVVFTVSRRRKEAGELVASLEKVCVLSDQGQVVLEDVDLQLSAGEIVGVAGVDGNGQAELAQVLTGLRPIASGKVFIRGEDMTVATVRQRIEAGLMYVPADRNSLGAALALSLVANAALKNHRKSPYSQHGILQHRTIRAFAKQLIEEYDIRCPSVDVPAGTLSGGNLQKLILARETISRPSLLVVEHPTRGLDVGATEYVRKLLIDQSNAGTAILLISADLDEVLALNDRVVVMYEGAIVYGCINEAIDRERIGMAMAGLHHESSEGEEYDSAAAV
jgi:simple sugar transport system ATP-binding protein